MSNFDNIIPFILKSEGGFVNDKFDSGGATNHGISLKFLKCVDISEADLNGDGCIDVEDIICMTVEDAKELYKKYIWDMCKLEEFNDNVLVQYVVFDCVVNCGCKAAIKILQRTLNTMFKLKEDGVCGQRTLAAYRSLTDKNAFAYALLQNRAKFYKSLCNDRPVLKRFLKGWLNRIQDIQDNFKLFKV